MSLLRWCLAISLLISVPVCADWVNLTGAETAQNIAEISIDETGVTIALEMFPADEAIFLQEDGFGLRVLAGEQALTATIRRREARDRTDRYSPFAGMVDPRTQRAVRGPPEDRAVQFFELHYAFPEGLGTPGQLTLVPPLDDAGFARAEIGFLLDHKSVPVVDFRYLSQVETLMLDWDDPWFTAFENRNLVRHHRWPQMTFLYLEPRSVRHESLIRVRDLLRWNDPTADVWRTLDRATQAFIKGVASDYFQARNPVTINGEAANRSAFRAEFLEVTPQGLQLIPDHALPDASVALLGISESYWVEQLPDTVTMTWELFDERIPDVPTNMIDPAGPYPGFISPKDPTLSWENFIQRWKDPVLEAVPREEAGWLDVTAIRMALLGTPGDEIARDVVDRLLRQTAIAYLERDPDKKAAALGQLTDPANPDLVLALDGVFALPTTGGGVANIEALSTPVLEELTDEQGEAGFRALVRWQVRAVGRHWGHVDQRVLSMRALLNVGLLGGRWVLQDITLLEARDANDD